VGIRIASQAKMPDPPLVERVKRFSLNSLLFYRRLAKTPESQVPGVQYLRSSHSVWLNYRAARRSRSRAEFISKIGIVVEEADECVGNLEYMRDGRIADSPQLLQEAKELSAIFTKSLATAKGNAAVRS
jgi:four helix bundle protein